MSSVLSRKFPAFGEEPAGGATRITRRGPTTPWAARRSSIRSRRLRAGAPRRRRACPAGQPRLAAHLLRHLAQPVAVRAGGRAYDENEIALRRHQLHCILAVLRRVADVLLVRL